MHIKGSGWCNSSNIIYISIQFDFRGIRINLVKTLKAVRNQHGSSLNMCISILPIIDWGSVNVIFLLVAEWPTYVVIKLLLFIHWPLARYLKLRVAHGSGMPGTFSPPHGLSIPACITARASCTCRDACWDRLLAVSFEVGGEENVPRACATRDLTYLERGPWYNKMFLAYNLQVYLWHLLHVYLNTLVIYLRNWCQ